MGTKMNEKEMILLFIKDELSLSDLDQFIEKNGIDSLDRDGRSILFTAIVEKRLDVVSHLIGKGCSLNLQDKAGFSPLHFAVLHDNPAMADLLLQNSAQLDLEDSWGNSPLDRALMAKLHHQDELVKLLKAYS